MSFLNINLIKKIKLLLTITSTITIVFLNFSIFFLQLQAEENTILVTNEFQNKKANIQSQIDNLSLQIDNFSNKKQDLELENFNLQSEIRKMREDLKNLDNLLLDSKIVIGKIEENIKIEEKKIEQLNSNLKEVLLELQAEKSISPLKNILTGKNLGEVMSNIYKIDNLEDKILSTRKQITQKKEELNITKKQNLEIQQNLEKTRALIKSRQNSLEISLSYNQDNISNLIETMKNQKKELDAQLDNISGDYLAEINLLRSNSVNIESKASGGSCSFEEKLPFNYPSDFFTKPTNGLITQVFHCSHDGIDIASGMGSDIYSVADGTIYQIGAPVDNCVGFKCNGGYGNYLVIKHQTLNGDEIYSLYGHLRHQTNLSLGQKVSKGQKVAEMGCTGYTLPFPCGVHLHFMLISYDTLANGLGCRYGKNKCYNPKVYIPNI